MPRFPLKIHFNVGDTGRMACGIKKPRTPKTYLRIWSSVTCSNCLRRLFKFNTKTGTMTPAKVAQRPERLDAEVR